MDILNKVAHGEDYLEISENAKIRLSEYSFGITPETTVVFPTSMVEAVHGAEDYIMIAVKSLLGMMLRCLSRKI